MIDRESVSINFIIDYVLCSFAQISLLERFIKKLKGLIRSQEAHVVDLRVITRTLIRGDSARLHNTILTFIRQFK